MHEVECLHCKQSSIHNRKRSKRAVYKMSLVWHYWRSSRWSFVKVRQSPVEMWWHTVTHRRRNWRMEWVASTLTRPRDVVYPALLTLMRSPLLPAVDWTDSPADLNGLVRLGEIRNLVSARVPSGSARALLIFTRDWDDPRAMVQMEGIRHWKIQCYHRK